MKNLIVWLLTLVAGFGIGWVGGCAKNDFSTVYMRTFPPPPPACLVFLDNLETGESRERWNHDNGKVTTPWDTVFPTPVPAAWTETEIEFYTQPPANKNWPTVDITDTGFCPAYHRCIWTTKARDGMTLEDIGTMIDKANTEKKP